MAAKPATQKPTHVALLRGINVGGKHRLPMKALAEMFRDAGCSDVQTLIQSGNVVFRANAQLAKRLAKLVAQRIAAEHGFEAPVVVRSAKQFLAAARGNPYAKAGVPIEQLHVAFLADEPTAAHARALDPKRSPPDEFTLRGRELYLRCPKGIGKSKLTTSYLDRTLATTATLRNQKTVLRLAALCSS